MVDSLSARLMDCGLGAGLMVDSLGAGFIVRGF